MSQRPIKFVHAADFHLEQPGEGSPDLPEAIADVLIDAPYRAVEQLFDTVIGEEADFLLLSGNLLDVELTGPRGMLFLIKQFERLRERRIQAYWAAGEVDAAERRSASFKLPDNVKIFSSMRPEEVQIYRDGVKLAHLTGWSRPPGERIRPGDFRPDAGGLFSIAVVSGEVPTDEPVGRGIHYWALGGRPNRQTTAIFGATAHWPGTPQGRSFEESGPHGCTVVQVDALGAARDRFVPTDIVRWHGQSLPIDATVSLEQVRTMLDETIRTVGVTNGGVEVLARFRVAAAGTVSPSLRREGVIADLLRVCRHNYKTAVRVWTEQVTIETDVTIDLPDPSRESALADFLRIADRHDAEPTATTADELFDFNQAAALLGETREWADVLRVEDVGRRRRLLREAAVLAHDLLAEEAE
jgi:DNA repair exonuclease SbcCD nuclease subunit